MLKRCAKSIYNPLKFIFKSYLEARLFSSEWKQSSVVQVFKKDGKKLLKIIVRFLYFLSLVKFLKGYFIIKNLSFLL